MATTRFSLAAALAAALAASPASGTVLPGVVMDSTADGLDPVLIADYDLDTAGIQGPADTGSDFTGIADFVMTNPLGLASDRVEITFDLGPGQFVDLFGVSGEDFVGTAGTNVPYFGEDPGGNPLSKSLPFGPGPFSTVSTSEGFAVVDRVVVDSFEGEIDQFSYRIVSAPAGDLTGDGFVGAGDLDVLLGQWNASAAPGSGADLSGDGFIGAADLDILLGAWNSGEPLAASASLVPEPASLTLLGLGALAAARRRR